MLMFFGLGRQPLFSTRPKAARVFFFWFGCLRLEREIGGKSTTLIIHPMSSSQWLSTPLCRSLYLSLTCSVARSLALAFVSLLSPSLSLFSPPRSSSLSLKLPPPLYPSAFSTAFSLSSLFSLLSPLSPFFFNLSIKISVYAFLPSHGHGGIVATQG